MFNTFFRNTNKEEFKPHKQNLQKNVDLRVQGITFMITGLLSLIFLLFVSFINASLKTKVESNGPKGQNGPEYIDILYILLYSISCISSFIGIVMILHSYSDTQNQLKMLLSPTFYTGCMIMFYFAAKMYINNSESDEAMSDPEKMIIGMLVFGSVIFLITGIGLQAGLHDKQSDVQKDL